MFSDHDENKLEIAVSDMSSPSFPPSSKETASTNCQEGPSPLKDISNYELSSPFIPSMKRQRNDVSSSILSVRNPTDDDKLPSVAMNSRAVIPCSTHQVAYIPGEMQYFWECPKCHSLPLFKRLRNSVVFYGGSIIPPTAKEHPLIGVHWKECSSVTTRRRSSRPQSLVDRDEVYDDDDDDDENGEEESTFLNVSKSQANIGSLTKMTLIKPPQSVLPSIAAYEKHIMDTQNPLKASIVEKVVFLAATSSSESSSSTSKDSLLVVPFEDRYKTAVIDILIVSQLMICSYKTQQDCNKTKRSYRLPENFPGVQCKHCIPRLAAVVEPSSSSCLNQSMEEGGVLPITKIRNGRWFCRSPEQLSNTLSKIQHHLINCKHCPADIKQMLILAKAHEPLERKALEVHYGQKATRSHYCALIFNRMDAQVL